MIKILIIILLIIISNKSFASLEGKTLICFNDTRGYNFISKDKVEISGIDLNKLNTFFFNYKYEVDKDVIYIEHELSKRDKEEGFVPRPIGRIWRDNLDYETFKKVNGKWEVEFL